MNRLALMVLKNIHKLPGAYSKLCHYAKHTDEYPEQEKFAHIRSVMHLAIHAGNVEVKVTGLENIPKENGYLLYGNHQGMFDLGCVFKKELANVPLLKQVIACTKSFAMDREDVRQSLTVIQNVTKEVQSGRNYLIFPEGTRSKNGNTMGEFHGGSFRCALKAKCPILPIAFVDSFKVLDQKGSKPLAMQIHYLPPISYEEYKDLKTIELAELVKSRIREVIDLALAEQ